MVFGGCVLWICFLKIETTNRAFTMSFEIDNINLGSCEILLAKQECHMDLKPKTSKYIKMVDFIVFKQQYSLVNDHVWKITVLIGQTT